MIAVLRKSLLDEDMTDLGADCHQVFDYLQEALDYLEVNPEE